MRYRLGTRDTEVAMIWLGLVEESGLALDAKDYGIEVEAAGTDNPIQGRSGEEQVVELHYGCRVEDKSKMEIMRV